MDSVGDDGVGEVEVLSSDDADLDEYLKEADELVMSPHANVSNRTEMTSLGNLDETVPVQDDDMMSCSPLGTRQRKLLHRMQLARH